MASRRSIAAPHPPPTAPHPPEVFEPTYLPADYPLRHVHWTLGDRPIERLHRHDILELGCCEAGSGTYLVAGKLSRFGPGSLYVIGPREAHFSCSDPGSSSQWRYLFCDPIGLLTGLPDAGSLVDTQAIGGPDFPNRVDGLDVDLAAAIRLLLAAAARKRPQRAEVAGLLAAVLAGIGRLPGRLPPSTDSHDRLAPALNLLADPTAEPSVADLAVACGLGEAAFRRAWVASFGTTPSEHLAHRRLGRAALRLRQPGAAVLGIALDAGYDSPTSFARAFRRAFGLSPSRWRAQV